MKKLCGYLLFALVMLVFLVGSALAQTGGIKGTIIDDQTSATLPGANVFLERTAYGAATDANGIYAIANVPPGEYTLVVSYVGYVQFRQAITIAAGEAQALDIKLKPSSVQLNPVIVTAIGTQANREQMGTSVSSIDASAIATKGAHDIISSIAALAPGVETIETTGDPGSATRIVLRGQKSFISDNQPLIVVDGVPVDNGVSINANGVSGVAPMSRISDINPDDIQSIQIYSGPSAASLWGSRAANGVIAITTKTGGQTGSKKLSLSVRSRTFSDEVLHTTPLQTSFGQGASGKYSQATSASWGDPIFLRSGAADVLTRTNYPYALVAANGKNSKQTYDHASELFRKPITQDYGVTLRGGDEWGDFYLDIGQLLQKGIILSNSDYDRTSVRGSATRRFTDNIIAKINASYISSKTDRIQQGSNISGLLLGAYRTSPDFDNQPYMVNYIDPSGNPSFGIQRTYRNPEGNPAKGPGYNNPFFAIYDIPTILTTDRLLGNTEVSYQPLSWMNFTWRLGVDYYTDRTKTENPPGDASYPAGNLTRSANSTYTLNTDIMGRATQSLTEDIEGTLMLGMHFDHNRYEGVNVTANNFIINDAPSTFSNSLFYTPGEYLTIVRTAAFYGQVDFGFYKQLFVKFTGRDESASTYGPDAAQTYFYPSASVAWQFTQLPVLRDNGILSFGKLRAAYGQAANQPPAYVTKTYYVINPVFGNGWGEALGGQYYNGAAARSDNLGNSQLKPEKTAETEFGTDLRFFNDRASLSATYYVNKTTDAILGVNIAPSSGYGGKEANAASIENKGTELQLIADWLHLDQFSWATTINWSHNKNTVTDLSGVESVFLNGFTDPSARAILNQPYGVLYGTRWDRKGDGSLGQPLNLDASGFPQLAATPGVIGNPNPNYRMGIINTFRYERLTLNVFLDFKQGGDVWNGTDGALAYFGTAGFQNWWTTISAADAASLKNWSGQTLVQLHTAGSKTAVLNSDGSYSFRGYVNNFGGGRVLVDESYYRSGPGSGFTGPAEQFVEKGSYVRLREVSLSYTFPLQFVGMQSATISVTGRNLKIWTDYTGNDPESNLTGPSNGQGLDYFNNPTTKSWILSIQLDY